MHSALLLWWWFVQVFESYNSSVHTPCASIMTRPIRLYTNWQRDFQSVPETTCVEPTLTQFVLDAELAREDSGGQLVPDRENCVRVGSTQVVSGTDWKFICQLVCVGITSLKRTTGGVDCSVFFVFVFFFY